jgi:hypothetical protein
MRPRVVRTESDSAKRKLPKTAFAISRGFPL